MPATAAFFRSLEGPARPTEAATGRAGQIDVSTQMRDRHALLFITNTGPAVDPAPVERLAQPFQRLASERATRGEGAGLGLSIVQAITEAHAGSLSIRPQPGGGLAVEVCFQPLTGRTPSSQNGGPVTSASGQRSSQPLPQLKED
jgi:K+-sensing histidine kinase KdpD